MRFCEVVLALALSAVSVRGDGNQLNPITPGEAAKQVNKECLVEMQVKSIGKSRNRYFLNSEVSFRDAKNFSILIDSDVLPKFKKARIENPADYYKDKTIRVKGKVVQLRNFNLPPRLEIKVQGPEQIEIVEKKK